MQKPVVIFSDHNDFMKAACDASLGEQLRFIIAKLLEGENDCRLQFDQNTRVFGANSRNSRQRLKQSLVGGGGFYSKMGRKDAPFVICRPHAKCNRLDWVTALWKWRKWARQDNYDHFFEANIEVDARWRRKHLFGVSVQNYSDLYCVLLPLYIPVVYLEAFNEYRNMSQALKLFRPEVIYTATGLHGHTLLKTLAADWQQDGTSLLNHQHGGGYGVDRVHPVENYETEVTDCFYTLGWHGIKSNQVPLVGALSKMDINTNNKNRRILLNCVSFPKQVFRLHFHPMPGTIEKLISETQDFVSQMRTYSKLVIRPYINDYGWGIINALKRVDPNILIDDLHNSVFDSFARSDLVVHNYLGTSWLETLALNIPTVCFYDNDTYSFRSTVQPYIDDLISVGILHQTALDAANFIRGVIKDPKIWWQLPDVQEARKSFVTNYANYSSDWPGKWEAEFRQWID